MKKLLLSGALFIILAFLCGCGSKPSKYATISSAPITPASANPELSTGLPVSNNVIVTKTERANSPVFYETTAPGIPLAVTLTESPSF